MSRTIATRKWLSRKRAIAGNLIGRPTGFFTQYGFMQSVQPIALYPDVLRRCAAADTAAVTAVLAQNDAAFGADPFWRVTTRHLGMLDAAIDYAVARAFRPERVIEVGCGRSTQVLAKAVGDNGRGAIVGLDPAPRLDIAGLPVTFHRRVLEPGDAALVAELGADDVLFIDSSHILQPGTDVDIQLNILLPALRPGVLVHVHDVFLPWGYPQEWGPRNWNEVSGLIPWISSGAFEIVFPSFYLLRERPEELRGAMPGFFPTIADPVAGSFWMRKRA